MTLTFEKLALDGNRYDQGYRIIFIVSLYIILIYIKYLGSRKM